MADQQHPDIAALVERLGSAARSAVMDAGNRDLIAVAYEAAAALRILTRLVEEEEVRDQIGFLGRVAEHIARVLSPATAEKVRQAASLLARLAREKASAEQEAARLRFEIEKLADDLASHRQWNGPALALRVRALAAAAGAEEPR